LKILIYGAGVIGSIFAGKLAIAGNDVTVLARGNRFNELKNEGIILVNSGTMKVEQAAVNVIDTLLPDDQYDYIIVAMQGTQVGDILSVLSENCSKNIVFVVNKASGYEEWVIAVGKDRLLIGFPSAGGERKDGKVYYFIGKDNDARRRDAQRIAVEAQRRLQIAHDNRHVVNAFDATRQAMNLHRMPPERLFPSGGYRIRVCAHALVERARMKGYRASSALISSEGRFVIDNVIRCQAALIRA
jgi:ketopantoate reductase